MNAAADNSTHADTMPEAGTDGPALDGADAFGMPDGDAGPCRGTLAEVGIGCPATYQAALTPLDCSTWVYPGTCGGLPKVSYTDADTARTTPFGWLVCVYTDVGRGTLVGAYRSSEIQPYCNDTSSTTSAGQVPDGCGGLPLAVDGSAPLHQSCDAAADAPQTD